MRLNLMGSSSVLLICTWMVLHRESKALGQELALFPNVCSRANENVGCYNYPQSVNHSFNQRGGQSARRQPQANI